MNVVTHRADGANGVLLRAVAVPGEAERVAAGPGLLARRFGMDRSHDALPASPDRGLWLAPRPAALAGLTSADVVQTGRVGISQGQELLWRCSVSRRARGDRQPPAGAWGNAAWSPYPEQVQRPIP